ncbi:hypothetical protein QQS21_005324 [Conoideocrella luteorostrata]|uniref:Peptidase S9 prolyl oligopeptidase catalytic domain-containing protein n=1 Tax=Conoideocrella luteorostrata TaxID=1105319 RepID=A0AAJ0FZ77_9HYPO|nr:hypothetical protein QQS21_005324 [Conoideocrella luteorostrata]
MTIKKLAPYGTWESPISVQTVTKCRVLAAPRVNTHQNPGRAFFIESTPEGRSTITETTKDGLKDVLPREYSVQNRVYEYGGSKYDVLPDNRLIFSNKDDTVRLLDPDTGEVSLLIRSDALRYSSFCANRTYPWVLAIEEDHTLDEPSKVRNYIVAVNVQTAATKRIITGADFYYAPQFSLDGSRVSWLEWNHPDLPFAAGKLYVADWALDGSVKNARLIAGKDYESVAEPRWGLDGSLFFGKELGSHRKLYRLRPGADAEELIPLDGFDDAEFAEARLAEGSRTYVPLKPDVLVASAVTHGASRLIAINIETGSWNHLADPDTICDIAGDAIARLDSTSVLVIGSGTTSHRAVHRINLANLRESGVVRQVTDEKFPDGTFARPETMRFSSKSTPKRDIFGYLWMPRNPKYTAPEGDLPPLIIHTHGGPTGCTGRGLNLEAQFFTSRGFAYYELNYTGSTGHGRWYREALFGNWGILDSDDVAECADQLVAAGRVKPDAIGITGASAGGYNTLQCLSRYPGKFAGGVCVCGISELMSFDKTTHKLESHYTQLLALYPGVTEEEKLKIYHERSAIYHTETMDTPLLLLHGQADTVVPIQQARILAKALKKLDRDVQIIEVEGEGHMFSKPTSVELKLVEQDRWWRKTLLRQK